MRTMRKITALLEAATGMDVPRLETQRAGKAAGWLSASPVAGQGLCLVDPHYSTLLKWHLGFSVATSRLRGQAAPLVRRAG